MFNLNVLILKSLQGKNLYGLEIIKSISEQTDGEIVIKQPSLYSALRRFEARGFVSSYWQDSDIGGKRHYYTLTDAGQQFLDKVLNKKTKTEELANKINSPYFNSQEDELVGDAYMGNSSEFS
ncbi:MAG: helix-turn-helix transcriptional regulator, partial [Clostridia bacterium]|nr:helix-turn-helix transcriptional regulator [Clostridia bacterium]